METQIKQEGRRTDFGISGKVALITGGSKNIGRQITLSFAEVGVIPLILVPGTIKREWGRIINLGGMDAYWGKPRRPHNVSAKLGLVGQTRALANEVARFGVTVNIVVPGTTDTYRHHPEWYPEIDRLYDERKEAYPNGQTWPIAGGCERVSLFGE